mmetsp:Transcript_28601/g.42298  ORF Transcript_28601/g.42298 Transcript_28601/m.42298 type:complete len:488 (+) Transcript_28601:87-1550(+)
MKLTTTVFSCLSLTGCLITPWVHAADEPPNLQGKLDDVPRKLQFAFSSTCDYESTPHLYVSIDSGKNFGRHPWGSSPETPYKTIQYAVNQASECQTIYVMAGLYKNRLYGRKNHNKVIVKLNRSDIKLLNYGEDRPVLQFDGPGAILGGSKSMPISNIEIGGFEIVGPNERITWQEAMENRLNKRRYYKGRGIAIWKGDHIFIHDMKVHHCPGSGIRVNRGDYITISDNEVYSNTWWSSSAESAIVLAMSEHVDQKALKTKMYITGNTVYDNVNKVPYYNPNYAWDYSPIGNLDCGSYAGCKNEDETCPWQCKYGKKSQDYIIDGSGVYVTRNNNSYLYGRMELSHNIAYSNGINGVVFHRTDRGVARQNTIFNNGRVPRRDHKELEEEDWHKGCAGKSRQHYSGLVLNDAKDVKVWSNNVAARYDDDYAIIRVVSGSGRPATIGGNNKVCKGLVKINPASIVQEITHMSRCVIAETPASSHTIPSK